MRLVLLDRDGTINQGAVPGQYVAAPEQLTLLDGAGEAIARLNRARIPVVVVTNQRGIARGIMTMDDVDRVHEALAAQLSLLGAHLDAILVCPHELGACSCRKPLPGMLMTALTHFRVESSLAVMVGDSDSDVEAGRRAGTQTIQIVPAGTPSSADLGSPNLAQAVDQLMRTA